MANNLVAGEHIAGLQSPINLDRPETRYAVDGMAQITIEDLKDNPVAIKQLMLDHAIVAKQLEHARQMLSSKEGEIEYLRTSPFVAIATFIITVGAGAVARRPAGHELGARVV